jgi:hypothetical protein
MEPEGSLPISQELSTPIQVLSLTIQDISYAEATNVPTPVIVIHATKDLRILHFHSVQT